MSPLAIGAFRLDFFWFSNEPFFVNISVHRAGIQFLAGILAGYYTV